MKTPRIKDIRVVPVAAKDSMLLNLSGAHGPYFTRNVVLIKDNTGNLGLGEVPGGERIRRGLEEKRKHLIGERIGEYKNLLRGIVPEEGESRGLETFDLRTQIHIKSAFESALLDLMGKYLDVNVASLLGEGEQRKKVKALGYLFYVGDSSKTPFDYPKGREGGYKWYRIRREEALNTEKIIELARGARETYGFDDFKLKGGVFSPETEIETVKELKREFPDARITIDPNGAWSLKEAISVCEGLNEVLAYCEDPCGAEDGYSGRETMAEFRRRTNIPTATNMIATDWRQLRHALSLNSVDIPLADPHFWTMEGSVRVGQLCNDLGLIWGCHSNNHLDISLAMMVQTAAAIPGRISAIDTHWIWQEGDERLCIEPFKIEDGCISLPDKPGLGVEIDYGKLEEAHTLYNRLGLDGRDDSKSMQYLIKGWTFDNKKPCMLRPV